MTKRNRKSKKRVSRHRKSPTVLSSTKTGENTPLPPGVAKLDPDKIVITTKETFIEAPVELCFDTLSKQLEQPPQWDPIIVHAWPASSVRGCIGAVSQLILNLGGKERNSQAVISRYRPNEAISWVLTEKPKVREDWQLQPKSRGTLVRVNFAQELNGWALGRLLYKVMRQNRVEQDLDRMLTQFKATVEGINQSSMGGG